MPINDYFIFNGTRSDDMGLLMASDPVSIHPARRSELIQIPGRNGAIVREDGSYDTYQIVYDVLLDSGSDGVYKLARDVAQWLLGYRGFCRLEDTFEPEHYRLARCAASLNIENRLKRFGRAQIAFDVQPQRYLKSGETPISYEGDSTTVFKITNPTQFEARPLLKFVDTSVEPSPVSQTLTKTYGRAIGNDGTIVPGSPLNYVSNKVDTSGFAYAIVTGIGYSFLDSSDRCLSFYSGAPISETKVIIPQNAVSVIIGGSESHEAELLLQAARPNPGVAAVTINGTTVNLDFSAHDTIFLDCDLHDAYYIDGSSANNKVSFANNFDPYPTFPGLLPGENTIIPGDGSNLDFELTPRWWTL